MNIGAIVVIVILPITIFLLGGWMLIGMIKDWKAMFPKKEKKKTKKQLRKEEEEKEAEKERYRISYEEWEKGYNSRQELRQELQPKVDALMGKVAVLNLEENKFNRFEIMDLE